MAEILERERGQKLIQALRDKGVDRPCPRCGTTRFDVVGEALVALNDDPNMITVGGPSIPVVLVACSHCGFLSQHAQAVLGVMRGGK